jgi:hypothetical protein
MTIFSGIRSPHDWPHDKTKPILDPGSWLKTKAILDAGSWRKAKTQDNKDQHWMFRGTMHAGRCPLNDAPGTSFCEAQSHSYE